MNLIFYLLCKRSSFMLIKFRFEDLFAFVFHFQCTIVCLHDAWFHMTEIFNHFHFVLLNFNLVILLLLFLWKFLLKHFSSRCVILFSYTIYVSAHVGIEKKSILIEILELLVLRMYYSRISQCFFNIDFLRECKLQIANSTQKLCP